MAYQIAPFPMTLNDRDCLFKCDFLNKVVHHFTRVTRSLCVALLAMNRHFAHIHFQFKTDLDKYRG